jgi:hypothetical protein
MIFALLTVVIFIQSWINLLNERANPLKSGDAKPRVYGLKATTAGLPNKCRTPMVRDNGHFALSIKWRLSL